ncbi:MAG: amino acid permease [Gammaproteobacteria bacterium]|nr:amino acid permease [Gammaproteobacteria bacterium]
MQLRACEHPKVAEHCQPPIEQPSRSLARTSAAPYASEVSDSGASFDAIIERERGLRRSLSARRMTMIAIGGAIGTGLFLGSGFAISMAGPAVLLSYLVGALIALLLMGCLAEMTVAHPTSGSFGAYAEYYLGPLAGFLVRYAYWTSIVLAVGTEVTAIALYMHYWFPATPGWPWILGFSALLVLVNARSVKTFGAIEYWFSAIKVTAIVLFIVLAAYIVLAGRDAGGGFHNYTAHGGFFPRGVWGAWTALLVAIFSYLSIEMIAVAAGEAAQPQIAVRRAFHSTVVRLIVFYLLTLALVLAVVPWTAAGVDESPFVKVMRALGVPAAAGIFNFVILVAALSAMNSQLYITTRMMFSLSRAGYAPRRFGLLNERGVPVQALLLSSLGIALATALSVVAPKSAFILMISISSFGAMFTWMMIFVTHYAFRHVRVRAGAALLLPMPGYPATTLLGAALMAAVLITTAFTPAFHLTLVFGLPFLGALWLLYRLWYRRINLPGSGE